ncbi:MAG: alginate lyase family protein [Bacteroidales bacterium]|jgi:hypothetical protein|nr:alginate lyase family protein [Bacteroidales bacterium]
MNKQIILFSIFLTGVTLLNAQFIHPGMLHTKADLDAFKANTQLNREPWKSAWQQLLDSDLALLSLEPHPVPHISCGPYNRPNIGGNEFYHDGNAAYTMALQWYATEIEEYAQKTIEILNAWSNTLDSVTNHNKELKIGVAGIKYLNAAEIIRYTYKDWKKGDQEIFEKMILEKWYPVIEKFTPRNNGNWDAAIAQTMMCIGIFTDRKDIFDRAYHHILDGETNGSLKHYFLETGQCQESGRDQTHTQMGLSYLCNTCEIAWN